jgi:Zn-dependent peptidase ImmA (M78 family)
VVEKKRPAELLDELGIVEPNEIDLDGIAAYCGAYVVYEPLRGSDARIVGTRDKAIITINSNALPSRQRFSIGHELGHWMWDRGNMVLSCSAEVQDRHWSGVDCESLANRFASELLMPAEMFRDRARGRPATMDTVADLATQFQSSLTATAIRVVECGSFPCMVLSHSPSGREWFFGSPEVDGKLWPNKLLDEYSFAHDLLKGRSASRASGLVDGDAWINHAKAGDYEIFESSVLITADRVLTLLWWENEKMISDLIGDRV